jgi:hypothetical protein
MDVRYTPHELKSEWDSRKASANLSKHRISFETACEVFFDPFLQGHLVLNVGLKLPEDVVEDLQRIAAAAWVC